MTTMIKRELMALSAREAQVALLLAEGKTCQEISVALTLGYETVRAVINRLRQKTGRRRNTALAVWAAEHRRSLQRIQHHG